MVRELVLPGNKTYYKARVIKTMWFNSGMDREMESDMNPCIYENLIHNEGCFTDQWENNG